MGKSFKEWDAKERINFSDPRSKKYPLMGNRILGRRVMMAGEKKKRVKEETEIESFRDQNINGD